MTVKFFPRLCTNQQASHRAGSQRDGRCSHPSAGVPLRDGLSPFFAQPHATPGPTVAHHHRIPTCTLCHFLASSLPFPRQITLPSSGAEFVKSPQPAVTMTGEIKKKKKKKKKSKPSRAAPNQAPHAWEERLCEDNKIQQAATPAHPALSRGGYQSPSKRRDPLAT